MNTICTYKVEIDGAIHETDKPALTGSEILRIAGKKPSNEYVIFLHLEGGDMESIRPSETVDLQRSSIEKFQTFKSALIYRFEINGVTREWGASLISGKAIKRLSGVENPDNVGLWQLIRQHDDLLIRDKDKVDLSVDGLEKFRTGAKFSICIEGKIYEWFKNTITTEEIIQLGGWDTIEGAVEVDNDQNEHTLQPGQVIMLKQGQKFCKKQRFKRGYDKTSRIGQEIDLLEKNFEAVEYKEVAGVHWLRISGYKLTAPLSPNVIEVAFSVTAGHPVPKPYGFFVSSGVGHNGTVLALSDPPHPPPFDGKWRFVSWDAEGWSPSADISSGSNLWAWARSFRVRLLEGE